MASNFSSVNQVWTAFWQLFTQATTELGSKQLHTTTHLLLSNHKTTAEQFLYIPALIGT
jgi:hypothetical protein